MSTVTHLVQLAASAAAALAVLAAADAAQAMPPELAKAQAAFDHAQIAGDSAALEHFLAPGYVLVNGDGELEDRETFIADWAKPGFAPDPVEIREPVALVWSDGAVLGGLVTLSGVSDGRPFRVTFRYLDVWRFEDGRWRVVRGQSTRVGK